MVKNNHKVHNTDDACTSIAKSAELSLKQMQFLHKDISYNSQHMLQYLISMRKYNFIVSVQSIPLAIIIGVISGIFVTYFKNLYLSVIVLTVFLLVFFFVIKKNIFLENELRKKENDLLKCYEKHIKNQKD